MKAIVFLGVLVAGVLPASVDRRQLVSNLLCTAHCSTTGVHVCGSNGVTYHNMCEFSRAACQYRQRGQSLSLVSHSACGTSQVGHVNSSSCDLICNEEREPVCASDGVVYDNTCLFHRAECEAAKNNTRLSIVLKGDTCPTPKTPDCDRYAVDTSDIAIEGGTTIHASCAATHHYVCGSDGRTYGNECQLCHHMELHPTTSLMIAYEGACHNLVHVVG